MRTHSSVRCGPARSRGSRAGFTIVELMVVIGIISVVVGLLSTALNQTKGRTMRVVCLDNMKQLQLAWMLYADDHNDHMALNKTDPIMGRIGLVSVPRSSTNSWVAGNPKEDRNFANLAKGTLYPYMKSPEVYRCPIDTSTTKFGNIRTRSYSISAYLGGDGENLDPRVKMRVADLRNPPPEKVFVFIEEHEESVWAGGFLVLPRERGGAVWNSTPTDRHLQGCNLTFADGHLEHWRWMSPKKANLNNTLVSNPKELKDLRRLQECVPKP